MRIVKQALLIVAFSVVAISCKKENTTVETVATESPKAIAANPKTASFEIEGMTCKIGCANLIERKLNKLDGVTQATVDFETKTAIVSYDADKLDQEKLTKTVEGVAGGELYKVSKVN